MKRKQEEPRPKKIVVRRLPGQSLESYRDAVFAATSAYIRANVARMERINAAPLK